MEMKLEENKKIIADNFFKLPHEKNQNLEVKSLAVNRKTNYFFVSAVAVGYYIIIIDTFTYLSCASLRHLQYL